MRLKAALVCVGVLATAGACKKSGGGGGWLVGSSAMMQNVGPDGSTHGYPLDSAENLNAIACRYLGEAWVVGDHGTLLYTSDAGRTWTPQAIPTTANLRTLATQDRGPVFVAGDGVVFATTDTGLHWTELAAPAGSTASFRSLAAAQDGTTVLAISEDGGLWSYANGQLARTTTLAGARAVAVSPDGLTAIAAGTSVWKSTDAGATWSLLGASDARLDDVRIDASGAAVAVGSGGALAHIAGDGGIVMQQVGTADLHTIHIAELGEGDDAIGYTAGDGGQVWITRDGGATWRRGPTVGRTVLGVDEIGDGHR